MITTFIYASDITNMTGTTQFGQKLLETFPTAGHAENTMIEIRTGERARLDVGAADPSDKKQVTPLDYDPVNNNKHWTQVR